MRTVIISEFKAKCIAVINQMNQDNEPIIITRRGKPVARIEPLLTERPARKLGTLHRMKLHVDIAASESTADWEVNELPS